MPEITGVQVSETLGEYYEAKRIRYKALKEYIESVNSRVAPLKKQLAEQNAAVERERIKAQAIADEISKARGGLSWFVIKKELGQLARELGGL